MQSGHTSNTFFPQINTPDSYFDMRLFLKKEKNIVQRTDYGLPNHAIFRN